jgi:hypothetical protein
MWLQLHRLIAFMTMCTEKKDKKPKDVKDNGGTRSGIDRRSRKKHAHTPERRSDRDRRSGSDRRKKQVNRGSLAIERRDADRKN